MANPRERQDDAKHFTDQHLDWLFTEEQSVSCFRKELDEVLPADPEKYPVRIGQYIIERKPEPFVRVLKKSPQTNN